jgi:chromosome segregation ATPase
MSQRRQSVASRNLGVLREVAQGIRWFVTDEVCAVASRALGVIHQLDQEVDKYRNEAAQAMQKLAKVTAEHNNLDNQYTVNLNNVYNKFHELEAAYHADTEQYNTEMALVREQYDKLQERFNKQQEQASQLHQQKVDFQHQTSYLQTKLNELTNTLAKEQEHSNHLMAEVTKEQGRADKLVETNEALKKKYADLWGEFEKLSLVKERLEVAERELDEKHKVVLDVADHLVEALQVASEAVEKARIEAASLRSV